jgi:transcription elongation factor Elf1
MKKIKKEFFPIFRCQHCGKTTQLNFDIDKEKQKWTELICHFCKKPRIEGNESLLS